MKATDIVTGTVLAALTLIGSSACSVEKTQPGEPPDVDMSIDPGRWPQYKVNWADVDVGTRETTVTVPVVRVERETRQVSVPFIDINPPGARDREERTIQVELDVPHSGYNVQIAEIRASGDDLWVIARLSETGQPAAQAVTRASDQVVVNAPADLDIRKVIVGTRPSGSYNQQYRFVDSMAAVGEVIPQGGRIIYQRTGTPAS